MSLSWPHLHFHTTYLRPSLNLRSKMVNLLEPVLCNKESRNQRNRHFILTLVEITSQQPSCYCYIRLVNRVTDRASSVSYVPQWIKTIKLKDKKVNIYLFIRCLLKNFSLLIFSWIHTTTPHILRRCSTLGETRLQLQRTIFTGPCPSVIVTPGSSGVQEP